MLCIACWKTVTLFIDNVDLPSRCTVKDLGVLISDSFAPQSHINKVTATANQRVNLLMRAFVSRDQSTLVRAYYVFVLYCLVTIQPT